MRTTLAEELIKEWQEARRAFLAAEHSNIKTAEERIPLWQRLANAEQALYAYRQ